MLLTNQT